MYFIANCEFYIANCCGPFFCEFCTESFWELVMENSSVSTLKVHGTVRPN